MNKAILIGRLTNEPEVRVINNNTTVCTFRIAVNRRFANKAGERTADFHTIVAWRQLGELCGKYLAKGRMVAVVGEIHNRSYDAKDGSKRYMTEIIADEIEFLTPKGDGQSPDSSSNAGHKGQQTTASNTSQASVPDYGTYGSFSAFNEAGFEDIDDDQLPF